MDIGIGGVGLERVTSASKSPALTFCDLIAWTHSLVHVPDTGPVFLGQVGGVGPVPEKVRFVQKNTRMPPESRDLPKWM
jgi:hypothetical protein